jgi:hypothetical protein
LVPDLDVTRGALEPLRLGFQLEACRRCCEHFQKVTFVSCDQKVVVGQQSGSNPAIASYNTNVVNFYSATSSLARFENNNILLHFEKRCILLRQWRCSCKFKSRRIGSWFHDKFRTNSYLLSYHVFAVRYILFSESFFRVRVNATFEHFLRSKFHGKIMDSGTDVKISKYFHRKLWS